MAEHWHVLVLCIPALVAAGCKKQPSHNVDVQPARGELGEPTKSSHHGGVQLESAPEGDGGTGLDWNLSGSHTKRVIADCTLFVKPRGDDLRDGTSLSNALRTPAKAVAAAEPGDVVCFDQGAYPSFEIKNVKATAKAPLVFRTVRGAEHKVTVTNGSLSDGHSIYVESSDHIHVYDLRLAGSQKGIEFRSSSYGRVEGLVIETLGQEAIHIGRKPTYDGSKRFLGPASRNCDIIGNTIRDTGKITPRYGEGIYIGTGAFQGDDTHDIFIAYNRIDSVRAEAIELKPSSYNHIVRGNLISNSSHEFHAAITVAVQAAFFQNGNYLIEDNRIYNFVSMGSPVAGISIGHGNAVVRNNVIWSIDGGCGIRTTTTFANPSAREVVLENNTVWTPGGRPSIALHDGDERTGVTDQLGKVDARNNATNDGSAGSTRVGDNYFVGPTIGSADAGQGPGSGFRARDFGGLGADLRRIVGN